eukprot:SAG22_NODE_20567_length_264_cov_1.242424_1_plen_55_part_10
MCACGEKARAARHACASAGAATCTDVYKDPNTETLRELNSEVIVLSDVLLPLLLT